MSAQTLRIFISSPGDVGQERVIAGKVLERLQGEFGGYFTLAPVLWEHEPLRATDHFQSQIVTPSSTDIVISILWSRLGTRLPPERFKRPDGTPYASGTEWEFEDAAHAYLSKGTPDLLVYRKTSEPPLSFHDERAGERLEQRRALDAFVDRWFGNSRSGFKAAFTAFQTPDEFENILEVHLRKLIQERLPDHLTNDGADAVRVSWFKGTPYRGLEAFDYDHSAVFFGRTKAIGAVKEALIRQATAGCAFVLVFGMSGGGKSSLVRAGVLPTITQPGVIEGVGLWRWTMFRPSDASGDLFEGLANALHAPTALPEMATEDAALARQLRDAPNDAVDTVRAGLARAAEVVAAAEKLIHLPQTRLALVVDQMEELFTREQVSPEDRERFVAALQALAKSGQVWVIGTMRSDFYPRCQELPALVSMKEGVGTYDLLPPTATEIGQMIRFPTRAAGLRFEADPQTGAGLDDALQEAAVREPECLPLLEFTLDELFRRRTEDRVLTFAAYRDLGGLEGALARRADEVFGELPAAVQEALPAVLRCLVTLDGSEGALVSRRVALGSVTTTPARKALTEAFIAARLLVTDRADNGEAVVRVAHEALLQHWPRLQQWLAEDRDFLRVRARVAEAALVWRLEARRPDYLLPPGKPLAEAEDILARRRADLDSDTIEFVTASERRAYRAKRVRTATIAATAAVFFIVVTAFSVFSDREARRARSEAVRAERQRRVAEEQSRLAGQETRLAQQQRQDALTQRGVAQQETRLARQQQRFAEAQKRLAETAQQVAVAQKAVAERNFQQAFLAADTMVTGLADGIKPIAGTQSTTVRKILANASTIYAGLAKTGGTPQVLEGKARMLNSFVEIYLKLNDTGSALQSAHGSLAIYQQLLATDPQNPRLLAGLARSHELLAGVILKRGAVSRAAEEDRAALALRRRLVARDAHSAEWQAGLADTLTSLAGILSEQGDKKETAAMHTEARAIRTRLAVQRPDRLDWQHSLAESLSQQGDDDWYADDLNGAERCYRASLASAIRAARQDPSNADTQKDAAVALEDLGYVAKQRGDVAGALSLFTQAADLAQHYSDLDPNASDWLGLLLDCRLQRADVAASPADPVANLNAQLAVLNEIEPRMQRLARADPANAFTQQRLLVIENDRAIDCARLAQLGVSPVSNCALAAQSCRTQNTISEKLARLDPTSERWNSSLVLVSTALNALSNARGHDTDSLRYELEGLTAKIAWSRRLVVRLPHDRDAKKSLADLETSCASLRFALAEKKVSPVQNYRLALLAAHESCAILSDLAARQPDDEKLAADLAASSLNAGLWYKRAAEAGVDRATNLAAAGILLTSAESLYGRMLQAHPSSLDSWQQLALAEGSLALLSADLGHRKQWAIDTQRQTRANARVEQLVSAQLAQDCAAILRGDVQSQKASNTRSAMNGLGDAETRPLLFQQFPLALTLYNSRPSTLNFGSLLRVSLQIAEETLKTPSAADLDDAQQKLAIVDFLFSQKQKAKALTPSQEQSQQMLLRFVSLADTQLDVKRLPALQDAVRRNPDDADARSRLAAAFFADHQYDAALTQWREADRLRPGDPDTINAIGAALLRTGQVAQAVPQCREALRLRPDSALIHANLGEALARLGQNAEALTESREALRLDPALPGAHYALGLALAASGRSAEARAEWRRALTLGDDDIAAKAQDALNTNL